MKITESTLSHTHEDSYSITSVQLFSATFFVDVVLAFHLCVFPPVCCVVNPAGHPIVYPTATAASYSAGTVAATGALWDMIRDSGTGAGDAVREVSQVGRFNFCSLT